MDQLGGTRESETPPTLYGDNSRESMSKSDSLAKLGNGSSNNTVVGGEMNVASV